MVKWEWTDIESTLEHFACLPSVPTIAAHCNPSLVLRYVAVRSRPQCSESLAERERVGCEHLWCVHPTLSGMRLRRGRARGGGRTGGRTRRCIPDKPTRCALGKIRGVQVQQPPTPCFHHRRVCTVCVVGYADPNLPHLSAFRLCSWC